MATEHQDPVPDKPPPTEHQNPVPDEPPPTEHQDPVVPVPEEPPPQTRADDDCSWQEIIIKGIIISIIIAGAVVLVVWLSLRPGISVYVESASLTSFNLSSAGTLQHNLSVELSMYNPSRVNSAFYRRVETDAYYDGTWFQWAPLPHFYLGRKKTVVLRAVMAGAAPLELGASGVELYGRQRGAGAFDLEVRVLSKARFRIWGSTTASSQPQSIREGYKCFLQGLRLGTAAGGFVRTKCHRYKR